MLGAPASRHGFEIPADNFPATPSNHVLKLHHAVVGLFLLVNILILIASSHAAQIVFSPPNAAAEPTSPDLSSLPMTHTQPLLSDLLTIDTSLSIFLYAQEIETSELFSNETAKMTLLAPMNKAVMALARKPHQGLAPLEDGLEISMIAQRGM